MDWYNEPPWAGFEAHFTDFAVRDAIPRALHD